MFNKLLITKIVKLLPLHLFFSYTDVLLNEFKYDTSNDYIKYIKKLNYN